LEQEITLYSNDESLWGISGEIKNSGGNLCLHLCGNLQHFIGNVLGKTSYKRNRENEFAAKGIPKAELVKEIQQTKQAILSTFESLDASVLEKEYPIQVFDYKMTTTYFLVHLTAHLEYHLGQINYHRRLTTPQ
jgi:uncharacterized damage-inducible protein DinB